MIEITYKRKKHTVTVTGHAHSGDPGHDLVCAAVTALTYTLAANVQHLNAVDPKQYRRPKADLGKGSATVSISPVHGRKYTADLIFDSICVGYELLAHNYPANVSYKIS